MGDALGFGIGNALTAGLDQWNSSLDRKFKQTHEQHQVEESKRKDALERMLALVREQGADRRLSATFSENKRNHDLQEESRVRDDGRNLAGNLGIGDVLDAPAKFQLRAAGQGGSIQHQTPTLPSLQYAGDSTLPDRKPSMSGDPGEAMTGAVESTSNPGNPDQDVWGGTPTQRKAADSQQKLRKFVLQLPPNSPERRALEYEQLTGKNAPAGVFDRPTEPLEQVVEDGKPVYRPRSLAVGKPAYHVPQPQQTVTIQTQDAEGNGVTRVVPKSEAIGKTYTRPLSGQAATHATANKEALDTLAQLDQAIEAAKEHIGPGQGRVSNIEQMIGTADPKIQALGVKMKAAKMRADHAITGSVRAGASPTLLAQWDNILSNKVDYPGLKAGVKALREVIGGNAAPAAGGGTVEKWTRDANGNLVKQ